MDCTTYPGLSLPAGSGMRVCSGADFFRSDDRCTLRSLVFPEEQTIKPMLMMNGMIAFLIAMIVLMVFLVIDSDKKNTKLAAENYRLKGQVDVLEQRSASAGLPASEGEPLTTEKVAEAVRYAGYVPEVYDDKLVAFNVSGERFLVETNRLPHAVFVAKHYSMDPSEWDMELMRKAAHLMSDEWMMVKALFWEHEDGTTLRFFVASMDHTYGSFRDNLLHYVQLIAEGDGKMREIYETLVKEKEDPARAINPFLLADKKDKIILS